MNPRGQHHSQAITEGRNPMLCGQLTLIRVAPERQSVDYGEFVVIEQIAVQGNGARFFDDIGIRAFDRIRSRRVAIVRVEHSAKTLEAANEAVIGTESLNSATSLDART